MAKIKKALMYKKKKKSALRIKMLLYIENDSRKVIVRISDLISPFRHIFDVVAPVQCLIYLFVLPDPCTALECSLLLPPPQESLVRYTICFVQPRVAQCAVLFCLTSVSFQWSNLVSPKRWEEMSCPGLALKHKHLLKLQ